MIIDNNLLEIELQLEPSKTSIMEFSKGGYVDSNMDMDFNGKVINNTPEVRFLGIIMDNQLKFENHISYVRGKMEKANDVVKYVSGVTRGPEINTALMLYKSLVRSMSDYGGFVYAPVTRAAEIKLERGQFLGLRTALGYRNSTPTNVIIAESKVTYMRNRSSYLAKNFCTKIMKFGPDNIMKSMEELCINESLFCYKRPLRMKSVLVKAWNDVKRYSTMLGKGEEGFPICKMEYLALTNNMEMDLDYGAQYSFLEEKSFALTELDSMAYGEQDKSLIDGVNEKYNMRSRPLIVYTDGSQLKEGKSTGARWCVMKRI